MYNLALTSCQNTRACGCAQPCSELVADFRPFPAVVGLHTEVWGPPPELALPVLQQRGGAYHNVRPGVLLHRLQDPCRPHGGPGQAVSGIWSEDIQQ